MTDDPLFTYRVLGGRAFLSGRMTDYRRMIEWSELALKAARQVGSDELELRAEWMLLQHLRVNATDRDEPDRSALEHCLPIAYELLARATASGNTVTQAYLHRDSPRSSSASPGSPRHSTTPKPHFDYLAPSHAR